MSLPISEKQLAANRANALRSTGPRTSHGKSRSSQNARLHGFTSAHFATVRIEDQDAVANLYADLVDLYHPENSQERFALERLAIAQHSLIRIARLESGLMTSSLDDAYDYDGDIQHPLPESMTCGVEVSAGQTENFNLAKGYVFFCGRNNAWSLFLRYSAQAERNYRRALEDFNRLRAQREKLPNEPIFEAELVATETTSAAENEPIGTLELREKGKDKPNSNRLAIDNGGVTIIRGV